MRRYLSCFLLLSMFFSSFYPIPSAVRASPDLIEQTCKNTNYYDLCVSSLKSDNSASKTDTRSLALIMVKLAEANATATNAYLYSQMANKTIANDTNMKRLIKECADKYGFAISALENAIQYLGAAESYDLAYLDVLAAADYPTSCRLAFQRVPGVSYPPELGLKEDQMKKICDVALGIIQTL